jgi:hypothetical protein
MIDRAAGFPELLERFARAAEAGDGSAFAALFTPDGRYDDGFFGRHEGRESIAAMLARFQVGGEAFCWQFEQPVLAGGTGYATYCFSYRSREPESRGELVIFEGIARLTLREGLIEHYVEVFDRGVAFTRLGYAVPRIGKLLARYADAFAQGEAAIAHRAHRARRLGPGA